MTTSDWHAQQDAAMERSLEAVEAGRSDPSPVFRTWVATGWALFYQAHLANLIAVKRADEAFRVLDLGCGTGDFLRLLADAFPRAELAGVDANPTSIARARATPAASPIEYVEGMFEEARALGAFDVVICSEIYEHVADPADLLGTAFDALRPGGYLSFSTPSGWMWRRPGLSAARTLANSPVGPRLRERPSAVIERARNAWDFYRRVRLRPEENWADALPYHPAVRPAAARAALERAGFEIAMRGSSAWLFAEEGAAYRGLRALERRSPEAAAQKFNYLFMLAEAAMNLAPPLRVFESRQVLLARKPG